MSFSGFYCLICFTLNITPWCPFQWLIQLGECAVELCSWWAYSCVNWETSTEKLPLWEETENQWAHRHTKPGILKVIESVMLPLNTYSWKHLQVLSNSQGNLECIFLSDYKAFRFENIERCKKMINTVKWNGKCPSGSEWVRLLNSTASFTALFLTLKQRTHLWNSHLIIYLDTLGLLLNGYMYRQCRPGALNSLKQFKWSIYFRNSN